MNFSQFYLIQVGNLHAGYFQGVFLVGCSNYLGVIGNVKKFSGFCWSRSSGTSWGQTPATRLSYFRGVHPVQFLLHTAIWPVGPPLSEALQKTFDACLPDWEGGVEISNGIVPDLLRCRNSYVTFGVWNHPKKAFPQLSSFSFRIEPSFASFFFKGNLQSGRLIKGR